MITMSLKKRYQPGTPFLHRNFLRGINNLAKNTMGTMLSQTKLPGSISVPLSVPGDDNDTASPKKRRRLSSSDPLGFDVNYLFGSPGDPERNTRIIEVLKVYHKDSKKIREGHVADAPRDILRTNGHCRITIVDTSSAFPRPLFCTSEACQIITYKNPVGPHRLARIYIDKPFVVPDHVLRVNRSDDDNVRDLADNYSLTVELEGTTGSSWPPLDWHDFGIPVSEAGPLSGTSSSNWTLSSKFESIDGRLRSALNISTGYMLPSRKTNYLMEVALHSRRSRNPPPPEKGAKPCITAIDPDERPYTNGHFEPIMAEGVNGVTVTKGPDGVNGINGVSEISIDQVNGIVGADEAINNAVKEVNEVDENGINGQHPADTSNELEDEFDGSRTPTRALRTREKIKTYNLKVLSDQAQGKERKRRGRPAQVSSEGRVMYTIPGDQPLGLDYFRCIMCNAFHTSLPQLQLHLQTSHSDFDCVLETTSQGPQFRIARKSQEVVTPPAPFSLGKPLEPFNLPAFISGDDSWVTSRQVGLEDLNEPTPAPSPGGRVAQIRQLSERPQSRGSHTGNDSRTRSPLPVAEPPKKEKVLVPDTKHQMFEPVSKRRLKPGEEVPNAPPDETWLLHKHRECLENYTDMTENERSYMARWDAFILKKRLSGSTYFKRAYLEFVKLEAKWLVGNQARMLEFAKHSSTLFIRNVLEDSTMTEAFDIINEARNDRQKLRMDSESSSGTELRNDASPPSPKTSQTRRGVGGCNVCELPVVGPRLLVCWNKACERRLYHKDCVAETALTPVTKAKWLCNACTAGSDPS